MTHPSALDRLATVFRSQWLASALVIPMIFLGVNTCTANQAAKEARVQAARTDRLVRIQESGKALDIALAGYFQSVAELGLTERRIVVPGSFQKLELAKAQQALIDSRKVAREALLKHASDIQALRGMLDQSAADDYVSALASMSTSVDRSADVREMGSHVTTLGRLVQSRNRLVILPRFSGHPC